MVSFGLDGYLDVDYRFRCHFCYNRDMLDFLTREQILWIQDHALLLAILTVVGVIGGIVGLIMLYDRKHPGTAEEIAHDWWDNWWWQS